MTGEISDVVAARVRELRKQHWPTIKAFAARCAEVGAPHLTEDVLINIEGGRPKDGRRTRTVTVDELLALSAALGMRPADLLVPPSVGADEPFQVTPSTTAPAGRAREWIGGQDFLVEPKTSFELARMLRPLPPERAALMMKRYSWLIVNGASATGPDDR